MSIINFNQHLVNQRRALEGEASVLTSADALSNDPATAAADTIANIMHCLDSAGINPAYVLEAAQTCYLGAVMHNPRAERLFATEDVMGQAFQPSTEAYRLMAECLKQQTL